MSVTRDDRDARRRPQQADEDSWGTRFFAALGSVALLTGLLTWVGTAAGWGNVAAAAREQPLLTWLGGVTFLGCVALGVVARATRRGRRRWEIRSLLAAFGAAVLYLSAFVLSHPDATIGGIAVSIDRASGVAHVTVTAHDLRKRHVLRVRWRRSDGSRVYPSTAPRGDEGRAVEELDIAPGTRATRVRVIAWVSAPREAQPRGLSCRDVDGACATEAFDLAEAMQPDLRASLHGRALVVKVARTPAAPRALVVLVLQDDEIVYKANPLVRVRGFDSGPIVVTPARRGGGQLCVIAAFGTPAERCAKGPGVARSLLDPPR